MKGAPFITFTKADLGVDLTKLVLVIPFVCIAYDLFIFGEHYRVRRIKVFLQKNRDACTKDEYNGQCFVRDRRDELSTLSIRWSSALITMGALLIIIINLRSDSYFWWFVIMAVICFFLALLVPYGLFKKASNKLDK